MNAGRRALVTGAGGFVCRHIVEALLADGWQVIALDRAFDNELRAQWANRVELIEADAAHLPAVEVSAVVHGAAVTAAPETLGQTPEAYLRDHLDTALDLIGWAHARRARVVLISSDAVFRATPPGPLDENAPIQPQGVYAVAKAALEQIAHTLHIEHDRDVLAIRLGGIYGPGERARASRPRTSQIARMVEQALGAARITVDPSAPARAWTFAPDIGAAVRSLLDRPVLAHALYHVASEELLTPQAAAAAICAQLSEQNVTIQAAPGGQPHDPRRHYLSSRRLRDEIGFDAWTPFAHGIAAALDWQRAHREAAV